MDINVPNQMLFLEEQWDLALQVLECSATVVNVGTCAHVFVMIMMK